MSIPHVLLALLGREDTHGYQLRSEFESVTGNVWPLNVGQVYTTLSRLERDGLVEPVQSDDDGRITYTLTQAGREAVDSWFADPVALATLPRNELAIKLAVGAAVDRPDLGEVIQRQRSSAVADLQGLTRLRTRSQDDLSWSLVLEGIRLQKEAEVKWLDHCELALASRPSRTATTAVVHPTGARGRAEVKS